MVLTGTDPGRGKHGGDVHFKEECCSIYLCLCTSESGEKRENMTFYYLCVFAFFVSVLYAWNRAVYSQFFSCVCVCMRLIASSQQCVMLSVFIMVSLGTEYIIYRNGMS